LRPRDVRCACSAEDNAVDQLARGPEHGDGRHLVPGHRRDDRARSRDLLKGDATRDRYLGLQLQAPVNG